jgi:AbrB family looped-hinge helix DNA binding protein
LHHYLIHVVKNMVITVIIDSQGRILVPAEIRGKLHLEPNSELELVILGNEILLRKTNTSLESQVNVWKERLIGMEIEAGIASDEEVVLEAGKWVDTEYVKKKLGLH